MPRSSRGASQTGLNRSAPSSTLNPILVYYSALLSFSPGLGLVRPGRCNCVMSQGLMGLTFADLDSKGDEED